MVKGLFCLLLAWPAAAMARDCHAPWGGTVRDGHSVMAYQYEVATNGRRCNYEYRRCRDGYLSGSYRYRYCREDQGCQTEFGYIRHMGSITAYLSPDAYAPNKCQSEIRRCEYGRFSGSYRYRYCTEHP